MKVARIEVFIDAAFAFAVTLLVISVDAIPASRVEMPSAEFVGPPDMILDATANEDGGRRCCIRTFCRGRPLRRVSEQAEGSASLYGFDWRGSDLGSASFRIDKSTMGCAGLAKALAGATNENEIC